MINHTFKLRIVLGALCLTMLSPALAESLKVDFNGNLFGATVEQTQSGFAAYDAQNEVAGSFGPRSYSAFGTNIRVTPSWSGTPATNTAQQAWWRDNASGYSTNAADRLDLLIDWIGTDPRESPGDPLTLTISGLPAGTYGWLSYHHDTQNQQGHFRVTVNDAAGSAATSGLQVSNTQTQGRTNLAQVTTFATALVSDGVNPVSLVWETTDAPNFNTMFVINGFELTNDVVVAPQQVNAPLRRPISPSQPMWLIHIDTWNYPDPQKIIDLIPPDIRPYVVMNISLSISHDTNGVFQVAEYGYEIAKSWVRTCAENNMWCMVQPASGGMHQFSEFDRSLYEEFFRDYPNFIGFNYAEQFWGYDDPNDPVSAAWTDRISHFADLLALCSKYGGYLVVSWCGNQWDPNINPIAMLKRNPAFAAACRQYTQNYILEEKYTQQSYQSDMESVCLGAYLSGYSGQYGIRYDSTGWSDATGINQNFTLATGGAAHLEHIMLTGETVIDAPELIWQQCFKEISAGATDNGYTMRRWQTFPQFDNVSVDIFRKILDGTVRIPSRQEVIARTKVVIIDDVNSGSTDDVYSSPDSLFEGLYRMDGDGNLRNNKTFFKKTGRYPTVPTVYQLADSNANAFAVKVNKSGYVGRWPSITAKTNEFNSLFPQEYTGDIYAGRLENRWVIYNPYKTNLTASGSIPFKYNTCDHVDLSLSRYTSGVMTETSNGVAFYLCNYDNDLDTSLKTNVISIYGSTAEPTFTWADRGSHAASAVTKNWSGGVWTLTVRHNGSVDINVNCVGTATGRLTNTTPAVLIAPNQPMSSSGVRQYEAECFDYKNISGITKSGYSGNIRNYTGQGYLQFGTSSSAAVRDTVNVLKSGAYQLETRYSVVGADVGTIDLFVNGMKVTTPVFTQTAMPSDWAVNEQTVTLNAGANTIEFKANGTAASSVCFDNLVVVPTVIADGIVIQENRAGFDSVDGTIDNDLSGFTGAGYANTADTNGASLAWNLDFDASVVKAFTFRYASTNDSTANLIINGTNVASDIQFPTTGAWTNWGYVTVYASTAAGTAEVRLQSTSATGLPDIDYLEVSGGWAGTPPPSGLSAVPVAGNQINLAWLASSNATSYNVKRSLTSGGDRTVIATGVTATHFNDTGLAGGTAYYYAVSAVSAAGEGADSPEASATTLPPTLPPVADAYVQSSTPTSNFGGAADLVVKNNVTLATRIAYFMFDVQGLANVQSATVTLVPNRVDDPSVPIYYELAGTNWTENGITWNNQPAGTGVFLKTNTVAVGVPVVLDVTSATAGAATNGGLLSLRVMQPANSLNGLVQFCSKEHPTNSWRPVLTYQLPANTPPILAAVSNRTIGAGVTLSLTNAATDSDLPTQTLIYSLLSAPANAAINSSNGVVTWRPWVTQANTTNPFAVRVADNGTPSLGATQSFVVTVSPLTQPAVSPVSATGGQLVLQINGDSGPDYQIQSSTNLVDWTALLTTNSPLLPFVWTNNPGAAPQNFFRIQAGPPF
ncbi:MAG TPA: glycoside hydrolase family 98 domain-containing protein [Verrucomicrobiae bacterium]|nr:glycoside hydrolase family 98 domain-containing protein [Verrucomicrobiae bacterium]